MSDEIKEVVLTDDEGNEYQLEVLKEFDHKGKNYIMLYEPTDDECGDTCGCDSEECTENIYIYEVNKDNGDDTYIEVTDAKIMDELVGIAEKLIYGEGE
jgi:uncharacterized protein YrzB (UPF0473 family)